MSGFGRGMDFLMRQRAAMPSGVTVRKFWLTQSGDVAKIRFLTDGGDVFAHQFHEVSMTSRRGKGYTKDVLCTRRLDDEANYIDPVENCEQCKAGNMAWSKGIAWVFVEWIAHRAQLDKDWQVRTRGEVTFYMEKVEEARFYVLKGRVRDQVADRFFQKGTLTDRDFEVTRYGKTGEGPINYEFEPMDKAEPSEACQKAIAELRPLEEAVIEEFGGVAPQAAAALAPEAGTPEKAVADPPDDLENVKF